MRRKAILILILSVLSIFSITAKPEFWIGADFSYDIYKVSDFARPYYAGTGTYGNVNTLDNIKSIGPSIDIIFFPSEKVRLGIIYSTSTFFSIGYKNNGSAVGYKSYNFDYRQDFNLGLAYNQMFSDMLGMYANVKINTGLSQIATTNKNNSREDVEFNRYAEFGYGLDLGLLAKNGSSFFKLGASLVHSFDAPLLEGYSIQMSIGGGFIL